MSAMLVNLPGPAVRELESRPQDPPARGSLAPRKGKGLNQTTTTQNHSIQSTSPNVNQPANQAGCG